MFKLHTVHRCIIVYHFILINLMYCNAAYELYLTYKLTVVQPMNLGKQNLKTQFTKPQILKVAVKHYVR